MAIGQPLGWQRSPPWWDREGQRMTEQMVGSGYSRVRSRSMVRVDTAAVGEYNFQAVPPSTTSQVYTLNVNLAFSPATTKPTFQPSALRC